MGKKLRKICSTMITGLVLLSTVNIPIQAIDTNQNHALNTNVEASEFYDNNYKASYAVDGNYNTRWASKNGCAKGWFTIELTNKTDINNLVIYEDMPTGNNSNLKTVQLSYKTDDNEDWIKVDDIFLRTDADTTIIDFNTINAKYFKIDITTKNQYLGINVSEFELYHSTPIIESVESTDEEIGFEVSNLIDGDSKTQWKATGKAPQVIVNLNEGKEVNTLTIEEDKKTKAKVDTIKVEAWNNDEWQELKTVDSNKLPWKKNIFFDTLTPTKIRITFERINEGAITINELSLKKSLDKDMPSNSGLIELEPNVKPNQYQQTMIDNGYTMFIHFGLNTFTESEWTYGDVSPSIYAPKQIDADQWVKTAKEAGMKTVLLVTKHHDGFALWDSQYTDYDVGNPESGSHIDVVKAVSDACNKYNMNLGIYYSAWDNNWDKRYGKENDKQYNEYMRNQITELMSGKYGLNGQISELWIDGIWEKYTDRWEFDKLYDLVKRLQPQCQVGLNHTIGVGQGKPIHPVNQKEGDPIYNFPSDFRIDDGYETGDSDPKLFTYRGQTYYLPFEATLIMNKSWFYHTGYGTVPSRDPNSIVEKYNKYKDEDNVLVLNCGPNREGKIEQADIDSLYAAARMLGIASGDALKRPYTEIVEEYKGINLALNGTGSSDQSYTEVTPEKYAVDKMMDGKYDSRWASNSGNLESVVEINLSEIREFNYIEIQEASGFLRTDKIKLEYQDNNKNWNEIFTDYKFDKNGRLEVTLDTPIKASNLRLTLIDNEKTGPTIAEFQLYNITSYPELVSNPKNLNLSSGDIRNIDIIDTKEQVSFKPITKYVSQDEDIATVDNNGDVRAVSRGITNIIATTTVLGKQIKTTIPVTVDKIAIDVDKTALKIAIDKANEITDKDLANVVPVVVEEFKVALQEANDVYADASATQEQVNNAFDRLANAMQKLEFFKGDKKALEAFVNKVTGLNKDSYTKATWAALEAALNNADEVLEDVNTLEKEVNEAYDALVRAFLDLRLIPNKDLLNDLINKAEGLEAANYSADSFKAMQEALANAKAVAANENATQAEVDNAKDVLAKAITRLQSVDNTVNTPTTDNKVITPVNNGDTTSVKTGDDVNIANVMIVLGGSAIVSLLSKKCKNEQ